MSSQDKKSATKKPKLVRDSFTIPKAEFAAIEVLKQRALGLGTAVKKSELLRAGLKLLVGLTDSAYLDALNAVPTPRTGRPRAEATKPSAFRKSAAAKPPTPVAKTAPRKQPQAVAKRSTRATPAQVQANPATKVPAMKLATKGPASKRKAPVKRATRAS